MTRPGRLFAKNTGLRKIVRPCTGASAFPMSEGQGSWCLDDRGASNRIHGEPQA